MLIPTAIQQVSPIAKELDYVEIVSDISISATTEVGANTVITSNPLVFNGSTRICIEFYSPEITTGSTSASVIDIVLYDGASSIGFMGVIGQGDGTRTVQQPVLLRRYLTPGSGSHTYSVRAYRNAANGFVRAGPGGPSNQYEPAYIRISTETFTGAGGTVDGWTPTTGLTRTGNFTFTQAGDTTVTWSKGTRFKYTQLGVTEYGVVASSAFSSGTTTITLATNSDYAMEAGTLDSPSYSYLANPQGYPTWFNFTPTKTGWSSTTTNEARFSVLGSQATIMWYINGTSDSTATTLTPPIPIQSSHTWTGWFQDNSVNGVGRAYGGSPIIIGPSINSDSWVASGTKLVALTIHVMI